MATYLLTWNPARWPWDDIGRCIGNVERNGYHLDWWGCGVTKKIVPGDRLFLIKLGQEPRGIVASGRATSEVYPGRHWDAREQAKGRIAWNIDVRFDTILDPGRPFPRARLNDPAYAGMHWEPRASGVAIPDEIAARLEVDWAAYANSPISGRAEV